MAKYSEGMLVVVIKICFGKNSKYIYQFVVFKKTFGKKEFEYKVCFTLID